MATILYFGTSGSDDPTKAVLPFLAALGAVEAGHQAQIALMGEATYLMKDSVAEAVRGVGWPSVKELLTKAVEQGITIHV